MKAIVVVVVGGLVLTGIACGSGLGWSVGVSEGKVAGGEVFVASGCKGCHEDAGESIAPSLVGLYGRDVLLEGGDTVLAGEDYLRESILFPSARLVEGYAPIMPGFQGLLTDEQVDELIAYIRSLAG